MATYDYLRYKRDQDRMFEELDEKQRAEAAVDRERERLREQVRLEQFDKRLDELCPEIMKFAQLAGMPGLQAVAWAFDWVRAGKQLARQPRRVC